MARSGLRGAEWQGKDWQKRRGRQRQGRHWMGRRGVESYDRDWQGKVRSGEVRLGLDGQNRVGL